jgi:hypothetical protein
LTTLLLSLHLLSAQPTLASKLHLGAVRLRPEAALGLASARGPMPQLVVPPTAADSPPEDRRTMVMFTETAVGAGVLLANDLVVGGIDLILTVTFVLGLLTGSSSSGSSLAVGSLIGLLLVTGVDILAVPFIAAGTAYGVSRLFDDSGGHFWYAVLASFLAEMAIDGAGLGLLLGEEAAFSGGGGTISGGGSAVIGTTEIVLGLAHLVVIPLAASFGLHFGQDVVPQRTLPTVAPMAPGGPPPLAPTAPPNPQLTPPPPPPVPPSYPSTRVFPLFQLRFG